ncbi:hypothetical protein [Bradyrhizobium sp.]|uniref:hypothetical protein n=1 Tax=Bradyrhizobium sp. TaxID=376 RepID=UPI003C6133AC
MLRKTIIALVAITIAGCALPSGASAHGAGGGGGGHGGGGSFGGHGGGGFGGHAGGGFGGFHGGGFHGFHGGGWGFGVYGPYGYDYPYGYYPDDEDNDVVCYVRRQRVHTRHGWFIRRIRFCE